MTEKSIIKEEIEENADFFDVVVTDEMVEDFYNNWYDEVEDETMSYREEIANQTFNYLEAKSSMYKKEA